MKELGDYLSEIRKSNGVGIEEAADDLNISINTLKNIENGNTRAFKDMLELRENVKSYAKYLGLNPSEVVDEFNDFLFEHTSKISLQDILDAEKQSKKNNTDVVSPYTHSKSKQFDLKYIKIVGVVFGAILFLIIVFIILKSILIVDNNVNTELLGSIDIKEVN